MADRKQPSSSSPALGEEAGSQGLGDEVRARGAWGDETDASFQEYVAREHVDGGMPVIELHRNHGIALSAVKRWIATYRESGRKGLELAAAAAATREQKRLKAVLAKKPDPKLIAELTLKIESGDIKTKRQAYAIVGKKRLVALVPTIVAVIRATKPGYSIQDELELLAQLRAKDALSELVASTLPIMKGYSSWMAGLLVTASKA